MQTFEQLSKSTQDNAVSHILSAYHKSPEWTHILNTALEIQTGLCSLIQEKESLEIGDEILDPDFLEQTFNDFDMPASIRSAIATVENLIHEGYEPNDILVHAYEIYSGIVAYWLHDIRENFMDYVEDVGMMFNDDGSIAASDQSSEEIGTHLVITQLSGLERQLTVNSFKNLHQPIVDLAVITSNIDPLQTNMKIDDLIQLIYRWGKEQRISVADGEVALHRIKQINDIHTADFDAVDALGWIIDILAASENIDQFEDEDAFLNLRSELPEHADLILFALELYREIDLTDKSLVTEDQVYWYLNEVNRHRYRMTTDQANAYAERMFNDDAWDKNYNANVDGIIVNEVGEPIMSVTMTLERIDVDSEATHEYADRLDENGNLPEFLAWDDSGEIELKFDLCLYISDDELSASFIGMESATMYDGGVELSGSAIDRIINCIGKSTLAEDVIDDLGEEVVEQIIQDYSH